MQKLFDVIEDQAGNVISGVTVTVNLAGTGTLATIFSDNAYTVKANPFTNNSDGTFIFYAANGRYDVVFTKLNSGFSIPSKTDILLADMSTILTPTAITGNTNDYNPTNGINSALWRISSTGAFNITGIIAGLQGQLIRLINIGANTITITNQDALSAAANRIITGTGASVALAQDQSITLDYDSVTLRWRKVT